MSFLDFYESVQNGMEDFYVGNIKVRLLEVSEEVYNLSEATDRIPGNVKSLGQPEVDPQGMKKFRATYQINDHPITNYLTAQNKNEAKRILFDYLEKLGNPKQRAMIANSSEIVPVDNWDELVKLLHYSMDSDRKNRRKKNYDTFQSIDSADFHLILSLVQKNPDFVKTHLAALPLPMQQYFKRVYNGLSKRDLDQDLGNGKSSYWGDKVKGLVGNFGKDIGKKLASVKTRGMVPPPEPTQEPQTPDQGTLGTEDVPYRPTLPMTPKAAANDPVYARRSLNRWQV